MPENADASIKSDVDGGFTLVEELHREGKLIWFPCDGDISCDVTVYVNEPIPEALAKFCHADPDWAQLNNYRRLLVKGDGVFGGIRRISGVV